MNNEPQTEQQRKEALRRKEQYKDVVLRIWMLFKMREPADVEAYMLGNQLMKYYAHLPLEEVYEAFPRMLHEMGDNLPKHYGEMTWEWMSQVLKLYLEWRKMDRYRQKVERSQAQTAQQEQPKRPPTPAEMEKMEKDIVAKAYSNFCEGKIVCLVPWVVYNILVRRGRIPADAYKQHLQRAKDMEKARNMIRQKESKRGKVEESLGEQVKNGLDMSADNMAKDHTIRLYFEDFRNKKLAASGQNSKSGVPQVRVEENAQ